MTGSHALDANERILHEEAGLGAMQAQARGGGNGFNPTSLEAFDGKDGKVRAAISLPCDMLGQYVFSKIPSSNDPILGAISEGVSRIGEEYFMLQKHKNGKNLLETPFKGVPILGKIVQNGWSLAHLAGGLTTIGSLYTMRDINDIEVPIYLRGRKEREPALRDFYALANQVISGNARGVIESVKDSLMRLENIEATLAGCYGELTDEDIKQVMEPDKLKPYFMKNELWLTGRKGKRTVVSTDQRTGVQIIRYDRCSPLDLFACHGSTDIVYTGTDMWFELLEPYFSDTAKQRFYEMEAGISTGVTRKAYGERRGDGIRNPMANYI